MAEAAQIVASLTVVGDQVDPDEVTAILGSAPDDAGKVGDPVSPHSSDKRRTGFWSISTTGRMPDTASLSQHVQSLLTRVTTDAAAWKELATRHSIRVFVGWFMEKENEGAGLDPGLLQELARRGVAIDFDIYSPPA